MKAERISLTIGEICAELGKIIHLGALQLEAIDYGIIRLSQKLKGK